MHLAPSSARICVARGDMIERSFASEVSTQYSDSRTQMELQRQSIIIGAPSAFGQELPGVESAPEALRKTGLANKIKELGFRVEDAGDVDIPVGVATRKNNERLMSPEECSNACHKIHDAVYKHARDYDNFVTIIGGDHSIALGSISGILKARPDACVVWVDAHADINTPETSGSGHIHGMPVAGLVGAFDASSVPGLEWLTPCLSPDRIVFIGLRDVDDPEKKTLKKYGIKAFSMTEIDRLGMPAVMKLALDHVNPHRDRPIHLSFDIDGIDPYYAPSTGTKVMGGLTVRESRYLIEELVATGKLRSMDLVEINPKESPETIRCDIGGYLGGEVNKTVALGVDLILTAHGKTLL